MESSLSSLLKRSSMLHRHLCPRQVLGVRMALFAGKLLGLPMPQDDKRLLVISETDGCAIDGISVVTGCTVGHRTLRIEDYGKIAATFVDTESGESIRIAPRTGIRERSLAYAPAGCARWEAYLVGYEKMPDHELLAADRVELATPIEKIISRPGLKAICEKCREEINNGREVHAGGKILCRSCAGSSYYAVCRKFPASGNVQPVVPNTIRTHEHAGVDALG